MDKSVVKCLMSKSESSHSRTEKTSQSEKQRSQNCPDKGLEGQDDRLRRASTVLWQAVERGSVVHLPPLQGAHSAARSILAQVMLKDAL